MLIRPLKFVLALGALLVLCNTAWSQCTPDTTITTLYSPTTEEGIADGTIGNPYEAVIHMRVPAETTITVTVSIDSVILYDITGLPEGIAYDCTPDSCVFPGDSYGCIRLYGTPTNPLDTGVHDLVARFELHSNFPTFTYDEEGYTLRLNPGQNLAIQGLPVSNIKSFQTMRLPMRTDDELLVNAVTAARANLSLYSILGAEVAQLDVQLNAGMNRIPLTPMQLKPGPYFARLTDTGGSHTLRLVVQ